jgi:hypothetical protein
MIQWIWRTGRTDCYLQMNRLKFKTWLKLQYWSAKRNSKKITVNPKPRTEPAGWHVTGWNREHLDLMTLCPKISPDIVRKQWTGKTHCYLQMNWLSLKNNRLKFKSFRTWWWIGNGHCDELENLPCGTPPKLQLPPGVAMVLKWQSLSQCSSVWWQSNFHNLGNDNYSLRLLDFVLASS